MEQARRLSDSGFDPFGPDSDLFLEEFLTRAAGYAGALPSFPGGGAAAALEKNLESINAKLKEAGFDPAAVRAAVAPRASALAARLKSCESAAEGVAAFGSFFAGAVREVYEDAGSPDQLAAGVIVFVFVAVAQILISLVATSLMGPAAATLFGIVVVTPLTEELGRWVATRGGYGGSYTAVVNAYEFVNYVTTMGPARGFAKMAALRTVTVAMHTFAAMLQKWGHDKDLAAGKAAPGRNSFYAAVLFHAAWNVGAVLSEGAGRAMLKSALRI